MQSRGIAYIQVAHHWRTPKKWGAKCLYMSGAPPGAPSHFTLFSSLHWRQSAPELPDQASLSDSMTRLSDGMVVQARLQLNQGMGTFLLVLEINLPVWCSFMFIMFCWYSCWFSLWFSLVLIGFKLVVISFDVLVSASVQAFVDAFLSIFHDACMAV